MLKRIETDPIVHTNAVALAFLTTAALLALSYLTASHEVRAATDLLRGVTLNIGGEQQTWQHALDSTNKGYLLYLQCVYDDRCKNALSVRPTTYLSYALWALAGVALIVTITVNAIGPKLRDKLDDAKWLKADPTLFPEVRSYIQPLPGDKRGLEQYASRPPNMMPLVPLGMIIEQATQPDPAYPDRPVRYRYTNLRTMYLSSKMIQEHVVIQGATGTGKTSRVLNHFLHAFAKRGDAVILPDFKFPDPSGLLHAVSLFTAYGRRVWALLPEDERSFRVPLLETLRTHGDARLLAEVIMPTDAYAKAAGEFYTLAQQQILAFYMKHVADSRMPTMKEVVRLSNMDANDAKAWAERHTDMETRQSMMRILNDDGRNWGGFITGIRNALEPFMDDRVARMFTGQDGQNLDLHDFVQEGGLLYIGIPTDLMRTRRGRIIMRVLDNWLMNTCISIRRESTEQGAPWGKSIRAVYDEASQIGRLMNALENSAALRSQDIALIYGIQDRVQMEVVYGDDIWKAVDANIGTQVLFPTGVRDEAAEKLSRWLGQREIRPRSQSRSFRPATAGPGEVGMRGQSHSVTLRPLMTTSEIEECPYFLAIIRTKGSLPKALCAMLPTHDPKPSYYGLDRREFTLDNAGIHEEWMTVMGDLSDKARQQEVLKILEGQRVTDDSVRLVDTLSDEYGDWIHAVTLEGVEIRKRERGADKNQQARYQLNYRSFPHEDEARTIIKVRDPDKIRDYVREGWLFIPDADLDDETRWQWIAITEPGFKELAQRARVEIENAHYNLAYIKVSRSLARDQDDSGARSEPAREIIPHRYAVTVTERLLQEQSRTVGDDVIALAVELVFNHFTEERHGEHRLVSIPLNIRFDKVLPAALDAAQTLLRDEAHLRYVQGLTEHEHAALARFRKKKGLRLDTPAESEGTSADAALDAALAAPGQPDAPPAEAVSFVHGLRLTPHATPFADPTLRGPVAPGPRPEPAPAPPPAAPEPAMDVNGPDVTAPVPPAPTDTAPTGASGGPPPSTRFQRSRAEAAQHTEGTPRRTPRATSEEPRGETGTSRRRRRKTPEIVAHGNDLDNPGAMVPPPEDLDGEGITL